MFLHGKKIIQPKSKWENDFKDIFHYDETISGSYYYTTFEPERLIPLNNEIDAKFPLDKSTDVHDDVHTQYIALIYWHDSNLTEILLDTDSFEDNLHDIIFSLERVDPILYTNWVKTSMTHTRIKQISKEIPEMKRKRTELGASLLANKEILYEKVGDYRKAMRVFKSNVSLYVLEKMRQTANDHAKWAEYERAKRSHKNFQVITTEAMNTLLTHLLEAQSTMKISYDKHWRAMREIMSHRREWIRFLMGEIETLHSKPMTRVQRIVKAIGLDRVF